VISLCYVLLPGPRKESFGEVCVERPILFKMTSIQTNESFPNGWWNVLFSFSQEIINFSEVFYFWSQVFDLYCCYALLVFGFWNRP
jgi:hypothetical protein